MFAIFCVLRHRIETANAALRDFPRLSEETLRAWPAVVIKDPAALVAE